MPDKKTKKVKGELESRNEGGIKVNGKWYNSTKKTEKFVSKAKRGQTVEITVDGKDITFIKTIDEGKEKSNTKNKNFESEEKQNRIEYEIERNALLMERCKEITDNLFGDDEKYKDFLGQHCNSLFIQICRSLEN